MSIIINLDVVLARRKMRLNELSELIGITPQNLSILKTGKAKAIRLSTLDALCKHLGCQPGDILEYTSEPTRANAARGTADEKLEMTAPRDDAPH